MAEIQAEQGNIRIKVKPALGMALKLFKEEFFVKSQSDHLGVEHLTFTLSV